VSLLRGLALLACLALAGCGRYFSASGTVASSGGDLGVWRQTPEGCSRDPFDGLPAAESSSVLSFLWNDPSVRDPLRDLHRSTAPDFPMRLELARVPTGYTVRLDTVKTQGTHFDSRACTSFSVEVHQAPPDIAEGKPTLAGRVRFICPANGGTLTADVRFKRCDY
jgi:hypothetical protein